MDIKKYKVTSSDFDLKNHKTDDTGNYKDKEQAKTDTKANIAKLQDLQERLYAYNKYSLLVIIQAMDAAGKDGVIEHVMTGVNPQGTQVMSFKQPSSEEMDHDFLWRINRKLPERGRIGIFNRSHYEDVLVARVHNLVNEDNFPKELLGKDFWDTRLKDIKHFEDYLYHNGIIPIKIFLNVSKDEQKERFLSRIEEKEKNWKFSMGDIAEREHWDDYMAAYQEAIKNTASKQAPWYVIPADKKWFSRLLVSEILVKTLEGLNLEFPQLADVEKAQLQNAKELLLNEDKK